MRNTNKLKHHLPPPHLPVFSNFTPSLPIPLPCPTPIPALHRTGSGFFPMLLEVSDQKYLYFVLYLSRLLIFWGFSSSIAFLASVAMMRNVFCESFKRFCGEITPTLYINQSTPWKYFIILGLSGASLGHSGPCPHQCLTNIISKKDHAHYKNIFLKQETFLVFVLSYHHESSWDTMEHA